jgi:hypothetical protein
LRSWPNTASSSFTFAPPVITGAVGAAISRRS